MLKSVFEFSYFTKKNVSKKVKFFKISKARYFFLNGCTDMIFALF